jgi:hypothetical protein
VTGHYSDGSVPTNGKAPRIRSEPTFTTDQKFKVWAGVMTAGVVVTLAIFLWTSGFLSALSSPSPTDDNLSCNDYLRFSSTDKTETASYEIRVWSSKAADTAANEAKLADLVTHECRQAPSQNAQHVASSLAEDVAILNGN